MAVRGRENNMGNLRMSHVFNHTLVLFHFFADVIRIYLRHARHFFQRLQSSFFCQFQDFDGKRDLAVALCVSHFHAEYARGPADEFAGDRASQVAASFEHINYQTEPYMEPHGERE